MTESTDRTTRNDHPDRIDHKRRSREVVAVVAETGVVAIVLGALMGLVWWWVTPTEQWTVVEGGLVPADVGFDAWFAADGWFAVLGVAPGCSSPSSAGAVGIGRPVALVVGVIVGGGAGRCHGVDARAEPWDRPDAQTTAETAEVGSTVEGALGIRAFGVLFAPVLTRPDRCLALLVASARVDEAGDRGPATTAR